MIDYKNYFKEFARLPLEERREALTLLEQRQSILAGPAARNSLVDFGHAIFPSYESPWHIRLICEYLERVERREIMRLMILAPPRHGKSQTASINFPAWYLGRNPEHSVIGTSYSDDRANSFSRACRDTILSSSYQRIWRHKLSATGVEGWQLLDKSDRRFSYIAAGVGGGLTGEGANLLIIDDPIKDAEEAGSEVIREKKWNWYTSTARTRLQSNAVIVFITTRWDEDDPAGRALAAAKADPEADQWTVLSLPACTMGEMGGDVEPIPSTIPRYEALWPEKYPAAALKQTKASVIAGGSEWVWSALYQQQPSPREGRMIQRSWLKFWTPAELPADMKVGISWDMTFKDAEESLSRCAGGSWGYSGPDRYLLDEESGKMDFVRTQDRVKELCKRTKRDYPQADRIWIENKANGPAIISSLQKELQAWIFIEHEPKGSKMARMFAEQPTFETGHVYLPDPKMQGFAWVNEYVDEICRFPGEPNDRGDQTSQALYEIRVNQNVFNDWLERTNATNKESLVQGIPSSRLTDRYGHLRTR